MFLERMGIEVHVDTNLEEIPYIDLHLNNPEPVTTEIEII